ncbi:PadR family transcriptional regulator [Frankia tisae]|uniref:PadR family transcriptional regulator n=1 Tax=Frankia tisae TaxID=2950104 RepID=UPI0021C0DD62|nr:PadR family transcriptional regulator [Frankia tisae]
MSLRHAVLGLLADRPASGYDLLKTFAISLSNVWSATQSQVYAELGRLADSGQVTVTAEGARGRKEYAITESGRAELHRWLTKVEPNRTSRNDTLLRVFFLGLLEPDEAQAFMRREAETAAAHHEELSALTAVASGPDSFSVHGRLALEWGLRVTAAQHEWALWAEKQIVDRAVSDGDGDGDTAAPAPG